MPLNDNINRERERKKNNSGGLIRNVREWKDQIFLIRISNRCTELKKMFMYSSSVIIIVYIKNEKEKWLKSLASNNLTYAYITVIILSLISMLKSHRITKEKKNLFSPADGVCCLSCVADIFFNNYILRSVKCNRTLRVQFVCKVKMKKQNGGCRWSENKDTDSDNWLIDALL